MPHLRIEVSPGLATALDWRTIATGIHQELADKGWAALDDLKTRVLVCADTLAGTHPQAQQLVATLITTNPRPTEVRRAMAACVQMHLERAIQSIQTDHWVQCCVFLQAVDKCDYSKAQWNPPPPLPRA